MGSISAGPVTVGGKPVTVAGGPWALGQSGTPFASLARKSRLDATIQQAASVALPAAVLQDPDFIDPANDPMFCLYLGVRQVQGTGIDQTVIQVTPNTSTKAGVVPPQSAGGTNPLYVMRVDGASSLSDFTVAGTPQGHLYNGIYLYEGVGLKVARVKIVGIPGGGAANPNETFGAGEYRGQGTIFVEVEIDGRDSTGARVGGSGLGYNMTAGSTTTDCYFHDVRYGAGVTHYETTGLFNHTRLRSEGNDIPVNWERCVGTYNLYGAILRNNRAMTKDGTNKPVHAVADSDLGSSVITFYDPIIEGGPPTPSNPLVITHHPTYWGSPNKQLVSDYHLNLAGVDRTHDCLRVVIDESLPTTG